MIKKIVVIYCALFVLITSLPINAAGEKVLIRQSPIVRNDNPVQRIEPAPGFGKGSYQVYERELVDGSGKWHYFIEAGRTEPVVDLTGTINFTSPPAQITPGEIISMKLSITLNGHSYGHYIGPVLALKAPSNFGKGFQKGALQVQNRELPLAEHGKSLFEGSKTKHSRASLQVSKNAGDGFSIKAVMSGISIEWPYKLAERGGDCTLAKEIDSLIQELGKPEKSARFAEGYVRRISYLKSVEQVEGASRFKMCTNHDGNATLKMDTPEEDIRDGIKQVSSYVAWLAGLPGAAAAIGTVPDALTEMLSQVETLDAKIQAASEEGLTKSGSVEQVYETYNDMYQHRKVAIPQLLDLADRSLCLGITAEHMKLANLYHDGIGASLTCNKLEMDSLKKRIEENQPPGFSPLLQADTYKTLATKCRL